MVPVRESGRPSSAFALGLLCAAVLFGGTRVAHAGINVWTSNGLGGGLVSALPIDPTTSTTLYAGSDGGGVFKSTDGARTWVAANTDLTISLYGGVFAVAIDPRTPRRRMCAAV